MKALQIIAAARAAGVTVSIEGDSLLLRSCSPAPQEVVDALSQHKSEVIDLLQSDRSGWTDEDWRSLFDERAAIAEFDGGLPRQEAEARAIAACMVEWLDRHMARWSPNRCSWYSGGEHVGNSLLPFGTDRGGQSGLHSSCWRSRHNHRRTQAIEFFRVLKIPVPSEIPNDFAKKGRA